MEDLLELGSLVGIGVPAPYHDLFEFARALGRQEVNVRAAVLKRNELHDRMRVLYVFVWDAPGDDLPQHDREGVHIGFGRVGLVVEYLRRHPMLTLTGVLT